MRPSHLVPCVLLAAALGCGDDGTGPADPAPSGRLAMGSRHVCLLAADGGVRCWGANESGQLGRPQGEPSPAPVETGRRFTAIAAGDAHTCGLDEAGAAWCWGAGGDGQLAESEPLAEQCGLVPCTTEPVRSAEGLTFERLAAAGTTTCGLTAAGAAWCWGRNDRGQLGTDAAPDQCAGYACSRTPQPVAGDHRFAAVSLSLNGHGCGLDDARRVWCWGMNVGGQLGDGSVRVDRFEPVRAEPAPAMAAVSAGGLHTCAIATDRAGWCWGIDALGAGDTLLESTRPVPVASRVRFASMHSARFTTCALDEDGAAWCWGPNGDGEVGNEPVGSTSRFDEPARVRGGLRFRELAGAASTYCGIADDGAVWCWGRGENGELGAGTDDSAVPVRVPGV